MRPFAEFSPAQLEAHSLSLRAKKNSVPEIQVLAERLGVDAVAFLLETLASERRATLEEADRRLELVWTGPERESAGTRDTAVVMRELFNTAERHVLVAGYALFGGREIFETLTRRMEGRPALRVVICLNVSAEDDGRSEADTVAAFGRRFLAHEWPAKKAPELFYLPRSFRRGSDRAVLHAKLVTVDDARAFVTSANLTEAAHERNIEAGVLVNDASFARTLRLQFESLIELGELRRIPTTD